METNTLRIGNKIQDEHGFIFDVVGIGKDWITVDFEGNEGDVWEFDFKHSFPQPIELTEEILLKCGFENNLDIYYCEEIYGYFKRPFKESKHFSFRSSGGDRVCKVEHLHQLQNLYWCLCGKELEIRL